VRLLARSPPTSSAAIDVAIIHGRGSFVLFPLRPIRTRSVLIGPVPIGLVLVGLVLAGTVRLLLLRLRVALLVVLVARHFLVTRRIGLRVVLTHDGVSCFRGNDGPMAVGSDLPDRSSARVSDSRMNPARAFMLV
jgi:hypothetical protein